MHVPTTYFNQLAQLYARMDQAYGQIARRAGFQCKGCRDNCCRSLFYHHTHIECLYLRKGLETMEPGRRNTLRQRAAAICDMTQQALTRGESPRVMCPLNEEERCLLYDHRPMICRLHGVAHSMRLPNGMVRSGPGCAEFEARCADQPPAPLDRTPLYQALAALEQALRGELGLHQNIKLTVAQIITQPADTI